MEQFKYTIGGKNYIQRPLVLGQINQLRQVLEGMVIPSNADTMMLVALLGDRLPKALAIVLIEAPPSTGGVGEGAEGDAAKYLRTRDLDALAAEISFSIDLETTIRVVEDFFDCNPIASLLERFAGMMEKLAGKITAMKTTGSSRSSSSSPAETSQKETPSSGDTH